MSSTGFQGIDLTHTERLSGLSIRHLILFHYLQRTGSLSATGQLLELTQPAVTQKLVQIEKWLGVKLWMRRGRGKGELTAAGKQFSDYVERVMIYTDRIVRQLSKTDNQAVIRVNASTIPGEILLPGLIAEFQTVHKEIKHHVKIMNSMLVLDSLERGEVDIGFTGLKTTSSDLSFEPIGEDRIIFVVGPNHRFASGNRQIEFEDIFSEVLVAREFGSGTGAAVDRMLSARGLTFPEGIRSIEVGSSQSVISAIRQGFGVGFISEKAKSDLIEVDIAGLTPFSRELYLVLSNRTFLATEVIEFIVFLRKYFSKNQ